MAGAILGAVPAEAAVKVDAKPWKIRIARLTEINSFPAALATTALDPHRNPSGANNWSCKPSKKHPEPVILIHGTGENAFDNWAGLSPILKDQGYCVFALTFGVTTPLPFVGGVQDRTASATEIAAFVARV
ncbi:MAG: lipase, partial [Propionibacteriaceae bacterium]|nr:lipase [Propionibacteriaceae bacterium]